MKNSSQLGLIPLLAAAAVGCTSEPGAPGDPLLTGEPAASDESAVCTVPAIDIDRSLFVSPTGSIEQTLLRARFAMSRIMKQILESSGTARPLDGLELYRRWWDTQNPSSAALFPDNPHCDDRGGTVNGYPISCPRNEGVLARLPPDLHAPVAVIYRPDLAARDGSTCGEARVVLAKPNDRTGRNLVIFEAAIPNPEPGCGLVGCRKIARFWAGLSAIDSFQQRIAALERFYFFGLTAAQDGVATRPVLDAANLGLPDAAGVRRGQIRTNQFMAGPNPQVWQLHEFQLARACDGAAGCKMFVEPVTVKTNPWGSLFNDTMPDPRGPSFRDGFLGQLQALAPQDVNAIGMSISGAYNAGQSTAQGTENRYGAHFALGDPAGFRQAIADRLAALGVALTPEEIVARATAQSCGGCHQISNNAALGGLDAAGNPLRWPPSGGFVHALENGNRSPALNNVFLPRRRQLLEQLLRDTCDAACPSVVTPDSTPLIGRAIVH